MAAIKLSGIITEISGKLGGSIFGTSTNGSYVRQNSFSQQPNTPAQSIQRNKIGQVTQRWRFLLDAQRALWVAEVPNYPYTNKVGDVVNYNGFQLHNLLNANLAKISQPFADTPAAFAAAVTPNALALTLAGNVMSITYNANSVNNSFVVYASAPQNSSLQPPISQFRKIVLFTNTIAGGTVDFWLQYPDVFTYPNVGQYIFAYIQPINKNTGAPAAITSIVSAVEV